MRKLAAAAALFAAALAGYPVHPAPGTEVHQRPPASRRPATRGFSLARESLAAVQAAGSARATAAETGSGQRLTATSRFQPSGDGAAGPAHPVLVEAAAADPAILARLRPCLDPRGAAALFNVASAVRRMGPARMAGQVTVRYRLSVDLDGLPQVGLAPEVAADLRAMRSSGRTVTADVWLDQARRPARVSVLASGPDGGPDGAMAGRVDCRYYDWGHHDRETAAGPPAGQPG
jgi:hypothetical protein